MTVKVGVSLWTLANDPQRPQPNEAPSVDFGQRIGLQGKDSAGVADAAPAQGEHSLEQQRQRAEVLVQPDLAFVRRSDSQSFAETMTAGVIELYALGARAGQHLSYSAQLFLNAQAENARGGVQDVDFTPTEPANDSPLALSGLPVSDPGLPETMPLSQPQATVAASESPDAAGQPVLSYLSTKWPERHFQFLPRGRGLELLVRDYHLTSQERIELIDELSRRASSMPERPQQIWLNGQSIWQATSFLNDFQGEQHGR